MTEDEIKNKILQKGWSYNSCSRFLVETDMTPYQFAKISNMSKMTVCRWTHMSQGDLPDFVAFAFMMFSKMLLHGYNVMADL